MVNHTSFIYIINGQELTRLVKDHIRYPFGAKKSIWLTRAMDEWESFFRSLAQKPKVDPHWLEMKQPLTHSYLVQKV
ncbi:hypothetical protein Nepgr_016928 [Nepenthes gracilis]|uniref:Uncharacterized protein n=1 Tax=Nepenthes gracilis TaxID=150966 RepID=A0AAD3XRQ8_NEPGR|nr:hypothetical protein Nepgr_016928 [Nepenthes gracilis]